MTTPVTPAEVGPFVDRVWQEYECLTSYRTPEALSLRALEEAVELCLETGASGGSILEALMDSLTNQARKVSKKLGRDVYPSELNETVDVSGCAADVAEEVADVRLVLTDLLYVLGPGVDITAAERAKWEQFKTRRFKVSPRGVLYAIKAEV